MIAARRLPAPAPFADDTAGFGYFATDSHYQHLGAAIARHVAGTHGFTLVTGEPLPDGNIIERYLGGGNAGDRRASLVRCRPGMSFEELMQTFARQLGLRDEDEDGGLWPVLSQLMQETRKGIMRILVLHNADALDDRSFDELHRFSRLDEPHFLPVVLLASPAFAERLDTPALQFLKPAITADLPLQLLAPEEGAAFIHYQLRAAGQDEDALSRETIAAIAETAQGDPAVINRLAREALGLPDPGHAAVDPLAADDGVAARAGEEQTVPRMVELVDVAVDESAPPALPSVPVPAAEPRETIALVAPTLPVPGWRERCLTPRVTAAGYLVLVAASAATLLYVLAPGRTRDPAPREQAAVTGPELARVEAAIAAPPQPLAPEPPLRAADVPAAPEPPPLADEPLAPPSAAAANALAAVEPSAPPPSAVPEPAAAPQPPPAPEPPPGAVAMVEPEPAPIAPRRIDSPPAGDVAMLVRRGGELLAAGDIVSARHFFERAAEAGDAAAAVGLGKSYDPLFLTQIRIRGIAGDPAKAAEWYRRAAESGSAEAAARLVRLLTRYPG